MHLIGNFAGLMDQFKSKFLQQGWGVLSGTILMSGVYVVRGAVSYGYMAVAVRLLGTNQYGLFSIMYSIFTMISFVFGQAVETLLSKYVAEAVSSGLGYTQLLKRVFGMSMLISLIIAISGILLPQSIIALVLPEAPYLFYFVVAIGILESYDMGLRGILRGMQAMGFYGISLVLQMTMRLLFLVFFVRFYQWGLLGAGISLIIAFLISIFITILFLIRLNDQKKVVKISEFHPDNKAILRYLFSMLVTFGLMAIYYFSAPLLIKGNDPQGANELAGMFMLAVYVSRIPFQLSDALSVNLLPRLSRVDIQSDANKAVVYIKQTYKFLIPFGLMTIFGLFIFGPWLLKIFHGNYEYSNLGMALLGVNVTFLILMSVPSQILLSRSKTIFMSFCWIVGCVIFIGISLIAPIAGLVRFELGYVLSSLAMFILLLWGALK